MPTKTVRNYEAMVILNPTLTEDELTVLVDRLGTLLTEGGASLKETARWGRRRLAYDIDKRSEGYYVIYYFTLEGSGEVLGTFERTCRYDENVMRQMVVKVPTKKRGQEIAQLVPAPGYLADFKLEPRPHFPRRPRPDRGPAPEAPPAEEAPAAEAEAPAEEPAQE